MCSKSLVQRTGSFGIIKSRQHLTFVSIYFPMIQLEFHLHYKAFDKHRTLFKIVNTKVHLL